MILSRTDGHDTDGQTLKHLGASRVGYGQVLPDDETIELETSYTDGVVPLRGTFPLSSFGPENISRQRQGLTVVHRDVTADPDHSPSTWEAIETRSFVSVPLIRNGRFRASLYVNHRQPRHWSTEEIKRIEDVAARIWDAVERSRSEEALRKSEEQYRTLFESIDEGFCLVEVLFDASGKGSDYRFLQANPAFEKHTGLSNATGRTILEMVPDHDAHWFETYGRVAETGIPERFESPAGGFGRFYDIYAFRIGLPEQRQVAILFNDVSKRRLAERALRASEEQLHNVLQQTPVPIVVFKGPEFVIELANPSYQAVVKGGAVGRPLADAIPELTPEVWDILRQVVATGEPFVRNEFYVPYDQDSDGKNEDYWFNVAYHPFREADGRVSGLIAVLNEVTAQVKARQELERANRELEEFAYVASHDLQEPLRMVNVYTQLLLRRHVSDNAQARQYAGIIHQGVSRMEALIRDLLTFSRTIHTEETPLGKADLSSALSDATSVLRGPD